MKETSNRTLVELDVVNPTTGEVFKVNGSNQETNKYYSIKKITSRINAMDMFTLMEKTCKSSKDISIINSLTEKADFENKIRIDNISNFAKELEISRVKLTKFLKLLTDNNFLYKLDVGIYLINPFLFVGRKVNSNEKRESAQKEWERLQDD